MWLSGTQVELTQSNYKEFEVRIMSLKITYFPYQLYFRFEAGTSRGVLTEKTAFFIQIFDENKPQIQGWGEASPLKGLSMDDRTDFEQCLANFCQIFENQNFKTTEQVAAVWLKAHTQQLPSLRFAVETALKDLSWGGHRQIYDNSFFNEGKPIPINGLIWMGKEDFMRQQIEEKLSQGFTCLKMKIGAIDFQTELDLLKSIRKRFSANTITLRVDANGAFLPQEALKKLHRLAEYDLHSIEQPIKAGQIEAMHHLCRHTPLPIALDEELVGVEELEKKIALLQAIQPQYIILKPTLLGGFVESAEWIEVAEKQGIGWWITSALEANIGLNAICQFTAEYAPAIPQGLGTGQLYSNNLPMPLVVKQGHIFYERV
jgi:o-succinylbenzoate synthase